MKNEPPDDKTNKMSVRPAKTQISLGVFAVHSVDKVPSFLHADSEDSDQTGRMPTRPGCSESSLGAQPLCCFCHEAAHFGYGLTGREVVSRIIIKVQIFDSKFLK